MTAIFSLIGAGFLCVLVVVLMVFVYRGGKKMGAKKYKKSLEVKK